MLRAAFHLLYISANDHVSIVQWEVVNYIDSRGVVTLGTSGILIRRCTCVYKYGVLDVLFGGNKRC